MKQEFVNHRKGKEICETEVPYTLRKNLRGRKKTVSVSLGKDKKHLLEKSDSEVSKMSNPPRDLTR